jgi:DNA polymerase-1
MNKLFLVDALAIIYRAHYAFINNPRRTSQGMDTSAVFGFMNALWEIIKKEKPTHLGVAFDTSAPTFRHEQYEAYKANRQEQPEAITTAMPYIYRLVEALNIPILVKPGYEADDIIGTLAKKAEQEGFEVYMMTSDKDYCQLLSERIFMFRPATKFAPNEIWGVAEALEKFKIKRIEQVTDILGLQGDAVDNIPGIPGVGEKTAQKLIEEYESVENLIAHAEQLSGKLKENVLQYGQQAILCKQLATIDTQVPIAFEEEALRYVPFDREKLSVLFDELEFHTLKKRIIGEDAEKKAVRKAATKQEAQLGLFGAAEEEAEEQATPEVSTLRNIHNTLHQYHIIDSPEKRQILLQLLGQQEAFCFDTETTSLEALEAEIVGLALAYYPQEAYYIPFPAEREAALLLWEELKPLFANEKIAKIGQNLKYDLTILANYGVEVKGALFDTMLAHYLLQPDGRHNMDFLAEQYLHYSPLSIETLIGKKGKHQGSMRDVPLADIAEYAAEDADVTFQLQKQFAPMLHKEDKLKKIFEEVEMPLVEVLATMERNGVAIDEAALAESSKAFEADIAVLEEKIYTLAGTTFNIASPKQLGEVLFDKLKLVKDAKKTKTGQYATGEEVLSKLAGEHEIVRHILEIRELQKLKSTYIDALPALLSPIDRKIHTSYNQAVTATGRLSSTNPNLQNIPIKTAKGREIRRAFIPSSPGNVIVSADYSQIELRLMAAFSGDETMLEAFEKGHDIHATTAAKIYKVAVEEVQPDMRRMAKTANFSILYGSSAFNLSAQLGMSVSAAKELIDVYYKEFGAVKKYKEEMIQRARTQEYVETYLGRRRYLREINERNQVMRGHAERNAVNTPIQGTAADMIKIAMIRIHRWLKEEKLQSKMILQVHDELVFDAPQSEVEILKKHIPTLMKQALPLPVRMEVEVGVGQNWLEAH